MSVRGKVKNPVQTGKGQVKKSVGKAAHDQSLEAEGELEKEAGNLAHDGEKIKVAVEK